MTCGIQEREREEPRGRSQLDLAGADPSAVADQLPRAILGAREDDLDLHSSRVRFFAAPEEPYTE